MPIVTGFALTVMFLASTCFLAVQRALSTSDHTTPIDRRILQLSMVSAQLVMSALIGALLWWSQESVLVSPFIALLVAWALGIVLVLMACMQRSDMFIALLSVPTLILVIVSWATGVAELTQGTSMIHTYAAWPVLALHLTAFLISSACFMTAGVVSGVLWNLDRKLKRRDLNFSAQLPSLNALKRTARRLISIGMPFLTLSLVVGIARAVATVDYWYLSPRVMASSVLWLVALLYLFEAYVVRVGTRRLAVVALIIAAWTVFVALLSSAVPMFF